MRRAAVFCFVLCFAVLGAGACAPRGPAQPFVLRVGVTAPIGLVTPTTETGAATYATDLVFETLLRPEGDASASGSRFLHKWFRLDEDHDRWRLEPKPDVKFSDGSEVRPEDLARSLRARGFLVTVVEGKLDVLSPPGKGGISGFLYTPVYKDTPRGPVGTGPFIVVEQGPERVRLRRVEARQGRINEVELVGFETSRQAFVHLLRGDLQAMFPLDRAQAELLEGVPNLRVVKSKGPHAVVVQLMPRRLSRSERLGLARSLPLVEMAEVTQTCNSRPSGTPASVPAGRTLKIGYSRILHDLAKPALALRRALGPRGGELVSVGADGEAATADIDIMVTSQLAWPREMLALTLRSDGMWNHSGYKNLRYDAALDADDEVVANEALMDDPFQIAICRRERLGAFDARVRATSLGEWGAFDPLPDWEVAP